MVNGLCMYRGMLDLDVLHHSSVTYSPVWACSGSPPQCSTLHRIIGCFNHRVVIYHGCSAAEKTVVILLEDIIAWAICTQIIPYNWQPTEHLWGSHYNHTSKRWYKYWWLTDIQCLLYQQDHGCYYIQAGVTPCSAVTLSARCWL